MSDDADGDRPAAARQDDSDYKITLGSINGVFGVKGWVKVFSETEPRENVVGYKYWWIRRKGLSKVRSGTEATSSDSRQQDSRQQGTRQQGTRQQGSWQQVEVLEGRRQGKTVVARLSGVDNPEKAALLVGHEIAVDRSQMPSLEEGEYYWADLIGHTVLTQDGSRLGTVERLFATGANDVVVVRKDSALRSMDGADRKQRAIESELLIPWIMNSVIIEVDTESHRIIVDWDPDF